MATKMNPEIKRDWTGALRSGKYGQTIGALCRGDCFCPLGVLCNLHSKATGNRWDYYRGAYTYLGFAGSLPKEVMEWAGIDPVMHNSVHFHELGLGITVLNDSHQRTFEQIAAVIEVML